MDLRELEAERDQLVENRNNLVSYAVVWGFVLIFSLIIPRILRRATPALFLVGLVMIVSVLTITGLLLLARWIGIEREIREINAEMKHAKAKRNLEDVVARYEIGDDGELIEINNTEHRQDR